MSVQGNGYILEADGAIKYLDALQKVHIRASRKKPLQRTTSSSQTPSWASSLVRMGPSNFDRP